MKKALKWIGIVVGALVAFVLISAIGIYINDYGVRRGFPRPGVSQSRIPAGVTTTLVFENVTVIPMDRERVLNEQTVVIEGGRISGIGKNGEAFRKMVHVHPSRPFMALMPLVGSGRHQPKSAPTARSTSVCPGGMNCGAPTLRRE